MNTILIIISLLITIIYLTYTIKLFGVPWSISDTYYKLENRKKGTGWLFSAMCIGVGGLLLPALLELTPESYQFTAFLACAGLIFVGAAPQFKMSLTGSVHYGSAAVCVIFSQVWVALTCWWILIPVWLAYLTYTGIAIGKQREGVFVYKFIQTKPMFWVEIAALEAVYSAIAIILTLLVW